MNCGSYKHDLEDLLLDADTFSATTRGHEALRHVNECADCREELDSLRATMHLMNAWQAPELSPFFDTRLQQALRTVVAEPAPGLWARLRDRWSLSTHAMLKPVMAAVAALAVVIGGATYVGVSFWEQPNAPSQESATIRDLQSLDHNAQSLQELQSLDQDDQQQPDDNSPVTQ